MHLRRGLLLAAIVLGTMAIVVSIAPPPRDSGDETTPAVRPPAGARGQKETRRIAFRAPTKAPPTARVRRGQHVILEVRTERPGQAILEGLGGVQPVEPGTPATFDVIASDPGDYPTTFLAVDGVRPATIGRLVVVE